MNMTKVSECLMTDCAFNKAQRCHTWGINIGPHTECHTYVHASTRGGFTEVHGGVGACLSTNCKFNDKMECTAKDIMVNVDEEKHSDCKTFVESKTMPPEFSGYG
ncbi:MAG TPA: DUF1540 domain-containing protein [Dehalococcoidales bacterium]|nr:DUF1540 domain-containing protein [Dehalococcoidales bacterium]